MSSINGLKYTPPDFRLFKEFGRSLVFEAHLALLDVSGGYSTAEDEFMDLANFVAWGSRLKQVTEFDLVDMYGGWTKADDLLSRLSAMDPAERKKHESFVPEHVTWKAPTLVEVESEFADYSGKIAVWEIEAGKEYLYPALDGLLKRRLDMWEDKLDNSIEYDFDDSDNDGEMTVEGACDERSLLQYTKSGIHILRHFEPVTTVKGFKRMEPLPYYDTFCKRVVDLDAKFRQALKGRRYIVPWADPTFWWHQPETSQARTK